MVQLHKSKHIPTLQPSKSTPMYLPKRNESIHMLTKKLNIYKVLIAKN